MITEINSQITEILDKKYHRLPRRLSNVRGNLFFISVIKDEIFEDFI